MSVTAVANVLSFAALHSQLHSTAPAVATAAAVAPDLHGEADLARASRSYARPPLHELRAHAHAQRLPRVTCWNGKVVVEHPHVQDCPSRPASKVVVSDAGVWSRIAQCESGGNAADNTGNGYYGLLQFDLQTWDAYDGQQFASRPDLASASQQITVAERVRDGYKHYPPRGYGAWPVCGR